MIDPAPSQRTARPLVIIPTYNEASNIVPITNEILQTHPGIHILVIDDSSPDGTGQLVRQHPAHNKTIHLIERPDKLGLGTAYRKGFQWGIEKDYTVFIQMDADYSHDPADIPRLLELIDQGNDLAVGSRYIHGVRVLNWPLSRLLLSSFAGFYTRSLTGLPLSDPTSGFKAIHRTITEKLNWSRFTTGGYSFQIELHYYLWKLGAKMEELPITFTERVEGSSKMSRHIAIEAAIRVLLLALER